MFFMQRKVETKKEVEFYKKRMKELYDLQCEILEKAVNRKTAKKKECK